MYVPSTLFVSTTGDDNNSGVDLANALKTTDEAMRRLEEGIIVGNVTVNIGPGVFGDIVGEIETSKVVIFKGDVSSDPPQPLLAVTVQNGVTETRGAISVAGTFSLYQRLRVSSGVAVDSYCFVTKILGGGNFNVDRFRKHSADITGLISSALVFTNTTPAIGDTITGETLNTKVGRFKVEVTGGGRVIPQDLDIVTPASTNPSHKVESDFTDAINGVYFKGCEFSSPNGFFSFIEGNAGFALCKWKGGFAIFEGLYTAFYGNLIAGATLACGFNTFATFESANCFVGPGASLLVNQGSHVQFNGDSISGSTSWFDGTTGTALEVRFGSFVACRTSAKLWGSGSWPNTITIQSTGWMSYLSGKPPRILGGTNDFIVGGIPGVYASLPITEPNNCGIVLGTI